MSRARVLHDLARAPSPGARRGARRRRSTTPALAADPTPTYRPDRPAWDRATPSALAGDDAAGGLIVRFRSGASRSQRIRATAGRDDDPRRRRSDRGIAVVRTDPGAARRHGGRPGGGPQRHRREPRRAATTATPIPQDEPAWTELWGLDNPASGSITANPAPRAGRTSTSMGCRRMASSRVTRAWSSRSSTTASTSTIPISSGQAWTNPGESGDGKESNGVDDDGNGYIDDVHGWDFCHDDNTVHDANDDFHGTHVAGTIAAKLDGVGVVGVAPGVRIMALKFINDSSACGCDSQAIEAIAYAKSFGVRIANASWGSRRDPSAFPALRSAIANSGLLFVASAGNEGINNDKTSRPGPPRVVRPRQHPERGRGRQHRPDRLLLQLRCEDRGHRRARSRRS